MFTADQILPHVGFRLRHYNPGHQDSTCPRCSHTRKKRTDECVSIDIFNDSTCTWNCHHCGWTGPQREDLVGLDGPRPQQKHNGQRRKSHDPNWEPIIPPPTDAEPIDIGQFGGGWWYEYCDLEGKLLCYVRRIDARGEQPKDIRPVTYGVLNGKRGWHMKRGHAPHPLYGLEWLGDFANHTVFLLEGEGKADMFNRLAQEEGLTFIALSWMGGTSGVDSADLEPLKGRNVIVWPDADAPGREAGAKMLARIKPIAGSCGMLDTSALPDRFDAADVKGSLAEFLEPRLPELVQGGKLKLYIGQEALKPAPLSTVVSGLLHSSSLTLVYGPPKSGKSFWLTSLFIAIAGGDSEWMGHKIHKPGPVLYIACEGHAGFWKRLKAAAQARGSFPPQFVLAAGRPTLIKITGKSNLAAPHPDDVFVALETLKHRGIEPVAVAIDTVFRSFGGGNVNQSDHMNAYIAAVTEIIDRGIAVALVHHETKSGGTPAGSVTMLGAADTIVATKNGSGSLHSWYVEAAKDDAQTQPKTFTLDVTEIGTSAEGEVQWSCVLTDQGEGPKVAKKGRPKNEAARELALELLREALDSHGETPAEPDIPRQIGRVVHVNRWRDLYYHRTQAGETDETKRKNFRRVRDDLRDQKRIGIAGLWVWVV